MNLSIFLVISTNVLYVASFRFSPSYPSSLPSAVLPIPVLFPPFAYPQYLTSQHPSSVADAFRPSLPFRFRNYSFLLGAGLFSKAIGFFQIYVYQRGVGSDVAETGSGPGSFDPSYGTVWHLTYGSFTLPFHSVENGY